MVMEWQAEDEASESVVARLVQTRDRRRNPAEVSLDDLTAAVRAKIALEVRPGHEAPPSEEMIGEPSF